MANYSAIKAAVNAYIKQNGRKEITGRILNAVLNATIDSLGRFFQFAGGAMPTDDPGTPDQNVCYLATEPGLYTHFGNIRIENEEVALLFWNGEWVKQTIAIGIQEVNASVDNQVGTPSVDVNYSQGQLVLTFHNLKGDKGDVGDAAGFGAIGADINGGVGTPGVSVETSGVNTAKNLMFHFTNLKGETGVTSVVATIDNTSGTPSCQVSLVNGVLTLAFSGLKGLKGDTGVSADYPITIYNGLDSDATDQALSAAQGKVLQGEISQLEVNLQELFLQELTGAITTTTWNFAAGQTHFIIPVNGGEKVMFDNVAGTMYCAFLKSYATPVAGATPDFCSGYSGRQFFSESTGMTLPSDCRFLVINNPHGNWLLSSLTIDGVEIVNGVHGAISSVAARTNLNAAAIAQLQQDVLYKQYEMPAYPCFIARTASHADVDMILADGMGTIKNSLILRSFISLELIGFDKTKDTFVSLFRNGYGGNQYEVEFATIVGSSVAVVQRFHIPVAQISVARGVNTIDLTEGSYRIKAVVDLSLFPNGGSAYGASETYANFIVRKECFGGDENVPIYQDDLSLVTISNNLADQSKVRDNTIVSNTGAISASNGWAIIGIPVTPGKKYTFGGFYLGRTGYCAFYDANNTMLSVINFSDPNGRTTPYTATAPANAVVLYIDIKSPVSPSDPYQYLMVNEGESLDDYDEYEEAIDKICNIPLVGSENGGGESVGDIIVDLPVSDGSDIMTGYAYIETGTGSVKVKL